METVRKIATRLAPFMIVLVPLWLTLGRSFFGSGGWMTLLILFFIAPWLLLILAVMYVLLLTRRDVIESRVFGRIDSVLLLLFYLCALLAGIFLVDGGDTEESVASVISKTGLISLEASSMLTTVFWIGGVLLLLALIVIVIVERVANREFWPSFSRK